jgi:hypothetical protein
MACAGWLLPVPGGLQTRHLLFSKSVLARGCYAR